MAAILVDDVRSSKEKDHEQEEEASEYPQNTTPITSPNAVRLRLQAPTFASSPKVETRNLVEQGYSPSSSSSADARYESVFDGFSLDPREHFLRATRNYEVAEEGQPRAAALLALADARLALEEDLPKAQAEVLEALNALRSFQDALGEAAALQVQSKALLAVGEVAGASARASEALGKMKALRHSMGQAACLNTLAQVKLASDPSTALTLAEESKELFQREGQFARARTAQRTMLGAQLACGDVQAALKVARQLLDDCRVHQDHRGEAATLVSIAEVYSRLGQSEEALRWSYEAADVFKRCGDARNEGAARYAIGLLHVQRNEGSDLDRASKAVSIARRLFGPEGDQALLTRSLWHSILFLQNRPDEALQSAEEGKELAESRGEGHQLALALQELARVRLSRGEAAEARRHAREARAVCQERQNQQGEVDALELLTASFLMENRHSEALQVAAEILALHRRSKAQASEAALLLRISRLQLRRQLPKRVLRTVEPALTLFRVLGDTEGVRECSILVSKAQEMSAAMEEAMVVAKQAMEHYRTGGDENGLVVAAKTIYDARAAFREEAGVTSNDPGELRPVVVHRPLHAEWKPGCINGRDWMSDLW